METYYESTQVVDANRGRVPQGNFYSASDALVHGRKMEHIFSTRDNQFHLEQLTPIQKFYSIQGVLAYEDLIDRAMLLFCEQLEGRFINGNNAGKTCNLADWTSYCESQHPTPLQKPRVTDRPVAWDLLSEITWSSEMGFMKTGTDIKNMIHIGELSMMYLGLVCLVGFPPWT